MRIGSAFFVCAKVLPVITSMVIAAFTTSTCGFFEAIDDTFHIAELGNRTWPSKVRMGSDDDHGFEAAVSM